MKRVFSILLLLLLVFTLTPIKIFACTKSPLPAEYLIAVNITTHELTLFKDKKIIQTYPVATGKKTTPTPTGKFVIVNKTTNPYWGGNGDPKRAKRGGDPNNPLGVRWLGTNAGKKPGSSIGIHGTNNPTSIGESVSGGCIRMNNEKVIELFDIVPLNTPVWIGTTKKLSSWGIK